MVSLHMDRNMAVCLYGVRMKNQLPLLCQPSDLIDRLYRSDFIIGIHNRQQAGVFML